MPNPTNKISADILLFDGFSNLCLANTIEPLRAANNVLGRSYYGWNILTLEGRAAKSSSGLSIVPDGKAGKSQMPTRLFLISSYDYDDLYAPTLGKMLRSHLFSGGEIYGLDTGAWLMAEAGLLKGKSATIHWDVIPRFEEQHLRINVENRPYVRDGKLITCGGAMATFDLMLNVITRDLGAEIRFDVENLFSSSLSEVYARRLETTSDLGLTRKALAVMRKNLENPLPVTELSANLNSHPKTLERAFKRELGIPAGQVYKRLRLGSVRDLVENTNAGFSDIAVRCGYHSASAMTRAFKAEFGYTPSELRMHSRNM